MCAKRGCRTRRRAHPLHDIAHERRFSSRMRLSIAAPPFRRGSLIAPNPVIVVEVLSQGTCVRRDTALKFAHYFRHPAVQHYVIVVMERPDRHPAQPRRGRYAEEPDCAHGRPVDARSAGHRGCRRRFFRRIWTAPSRISEASAGSARLYQIAKAQDGRAFASGSASCTMPAMIWLSWKFLGV